tara:strand:+ start:2677 stop:2856 length:180 start_codon:yes stop_codon:yes gene_type:complete
MKNYSKSGGMSAKVKDCQSPASSFSQKNDNTTLSYKERQDKIMSKQASKLSSQKFKGRY